MAAEVVEASYGTDHVMETTIAAGEPGTSVAVTAAAMQKQSIPPPMLSDIAVRVPVISITPDTPVITPRAAAIAATTPSGAVPKLQRQKAVTIDAPPSPPPPAPPPSPTDSSPSPPAAVVGGYVKVIGPTVAGPSVAAPKASTVERIDIVQQTPSPEGGGTIKKEHIAFNWEQLDPELLQHCRKTNPVLHKNQYWV